MSGFSPAWLALREPADIAARHRGVLEACAHRFAKHESIAICDIGAGTGASLRAFADLLPARQRWTLVDYDAGNLAAAVAALATWADSARKDSNVLMLQRGHRHIEVHTQVHDLARDPRAWGNADLVTASAFFDLASRSWIERFVASLAADKIPLLATLTADDNIVPEPTHDLDARVIAAFHAHQGSDKGFGPAAGPAACRILEERLESAGYALTVGDSPWRLDHTQHALMRALLDGMVGAVGETGKLATADLERWKAATAKVARLTIGHRDVFAWLV